MADVMAGQAQIVLPSMIQVIPLARSGKLKVLGTSDLGDPNHASPAVAGGRMFIAGLKNLYAIGAR